MDNRKLVLLIDDDTICNTLNKLLIKKIFDNDVEILAYLNAIEAIKFLGDSLRENLYDKIIILLDLNMPVMDGWEFMDEYRTLPESNSTVFIYILSSSLHKNDVERASKDPNVIEFLTKPITIPVLKKLHALMS